jgi:hypothetical protein
LLLDVVIDLHVENKSFVLKNLDKYPLEHPLNCYLFILLYFILFALLCKISELIAIGNTVLISEENQMVSCFTSIVYVSVYYIEI